MIQFYSTFSYDDSCVLCNIPTRAEFLVEYANDANWTTNRACLCCFLSFSDADVISRDGR
uniref:Uncharacterized protein n=1 Tax=Anguilla anguilla TaxID=7936 RepID=A0A0E9UT08_ANGAN